MDIKLFVCCHRPNQRVPNHPLLFPIQVGAALAKKRFKGYLQDDSGENISEKNSSYCELTAQYWAWKNIEADYYGFFHYRRYLYPDITEKRPYRIERESDRVLLEKLGYEKFSELIQKYDLIVAKREDMYVPVREHYAKARFHHKKDMELMEGIVSRRHPEMILALEQYLSGTACYFGNIFIMKRQVFFDYCMWLFPLLKEFDCQANILDYSQQELRVDGYLAERLLGVFVTWKQNELAVLHLPRVHFEADMKARIKQKAVNILLPPGTRRRAVIKRRIVME